MNAMKIMVTGGAGFIGSHLCDALTAAGHQVIAVDNLVNGKKENLDDALATGRLTFVEADILDPKHMDETMKGVDVVYHLACLGVRHSLHSPFMNHRVNAEGTLVVLEAARKANVKHFYYISTSEVYGDVTDFPISETSLPVPKTVYGASKLAGEHYAYSYLTCFGLPCTVLRIFNNYGPRSHYEGDAGEIIPRSIVMALYGQSPVIFGDGSVTRDFFYVKDTARALASLLDKKDITGQIFNIGTGVEISMRTLIETLLRKMGTEKEIPIRYMEGRPADVPRLWVNNRKFIGHTGFIPQYDLDKGMEETIAWFRERVAGRNLLEQVDFVNWKK